MQQLYEILDSLPRPVSAKGQICRFLKQEGRLDDELTSPRDVFVLFGSTISAGNNSINSYTLCC